MFAPCLVQLSLAFQSPERHGPWWGSEVIVWHFITSWELACLLILCAVIKNIRSLLQTEPMWWLYRVRKYIKNNNLLHQQAFIFFFVQVFFFFLNNWKSGTSTKCIWEYKPRLMLIGYITKWFVSLVWLVSVSHCGLLTELTKRNLLLSVINTYVGGASPYCTFDWFVEWLNTLDIDVSSMR